MAPGGKLSALRRACSPRDAGRIAGEHDEAGRLKAIGGGAPALHHPEPPTCDPCEEHEISARDVGAVAELVERGALLGARRPPA